MLVVILGTGEFRKEQPNPMYFRSLETCNWYASRLAKRYGNYGYSSLIAPEDRVTTYCKATRVDTNRTQVYDH